MPKTITLFPHRLSYLLKQAGKVLLFVIILIALFGASLPAASAASQVRFAGPGQDGGIVAQARVDSSGVSLPAGKIAPPTLASGSALVFDGATSYVNLGNPSKLHLSQFTLETWFRIDGPGWYTATTASGYAGISRGIPLIARGRYEGKTAAQGVNYFLGIDSKRNVLTADFDEATNPTASINHPITGNAFVTQGVWHHAAATYDGATWRLYLDGVLDAELYVGLAPDSASEQYAAIGSALTTTGAADGFFDGPMDETRIWNRALTQAEIRAGMNQAITSGTGLVARWGMDEGSGTVVADSVATPANGTVVGAEGTDFTWSTNAPFDMNFPADAPTNSFPASGATSVAIAPTLTAHVTDPESDQLTVTFYGRQKGLTTPNFTIIALPDTEQYSGPHPEIFNAQTQWIVDNQASKNIVYVSHLGDIVDNHDDPDSDIEWANASAAMYKLDTNGVNIPYGLAVGNRDQTYDSYAGSNNLHYNTYFGVSHFEGRSYYGGHFGTNNDNHYDLISASGMDFIIIYIECSGSISFPAGVLTWADQLLKNYPARRGIVVFHNLFGGVDIANFSSPGRVVYNTLKSNPNLFLMLGGHSCCEMKRNDFYGGNVIYSVLSDYTDMSDLSGGTTGLDGWLRILEFQPVANQIQVSTYSPVLGIYNNRPLSQFTIPYNMTYSVIGAVTVPAGTDASVTWNGLANNTEYEWYAVINDGAHLTTGTVTSFTTTPPVISGNTSAGTTLSYNNNGAKTATADENGHYSFVVPMGWNGTVTPSKSGAIFAPATRTYTNLQANISGQDYGIDNLPTNIALSLAEVAENLPAGTTVGALTTTDLDVGDTHTYTLVESGTYPDNASFQIVGSELHTAAVFDHETIDDYTIKLQTDDGHGGTFAKTFAISISDANDAPASLSLSATSLAENLPLGTTLGTFSTTDQDAADTHTYSLVDNASYPDNASFQISGNALQSGSAFDYETRASYSINVRVDDGHGGTFTNTFTISITDANDAPTDIALSDSSIPMNVPIGTNIGAFSATDQDLGDTHTYSLVDNSSYPDNAKFKLSGNVLQTNTTYASEASYTIKIQANDGNGGLYAKTFVIHITPYNYPPTNITLTAQTIAENLPAGTTIGTFAAVDQNPGDIHLFSLVDTGTYPDNAAFQVVGNALQSNLSFDYETKAAYTIRVRADDQATGTYDKTFTISISDSNDLPTDISLSASTVAENLPVGTAIGAFTTADQDSGDTHTYSLVGTTSFPDNAAFQISGSQLLAAVKFDFETQASYTLQVKSDDGHGGTFTKLFTITITDANDAPTDITLSGNSVPDLSPTDTVVGTMASVDQDVANLHTYTLVEKPDNAAFHIDGNTLFTKADFNYRNQSTYSIRIQSDDGQGGVFAKDFTINVLPPAFFFISGHINLPGATLTYTDGTPQTVVVDASGNYELHVSPGWTGTISPSDPPYLFTPANRTYTPIWADQTAQDFVAGRKDTFKSVGTYDGWVLESTETSNVGGSLDARNINLQIGDDATNRQYKAVLSFNTASLPEGAVIKSVTLRIKQFGTLVGKPFSLGSLLVDIRKSAFGKPALELGDFGAQASAKKVGTFGKTAVAGWYSVTLTPVGLSKINTIGLTQLRLYFTQDDNNNLFSDLLRLYSGNAALAYRPQLIITYNLP